MEKHNNLTIDERMKKSLTFALTATLIAGTSNVSVIKDKIQISKSNRGTIVIQQR